MSILSAESGSCEAIIEAISASADGEDSDLDRSMVDVHLAACASCREFDRSVRGSQRSMVLSAAPALVDLSGELVRRNARRERTRNWGIARILLALVAIAILALSLPELLLGEDGATSSHDARHLGAFTMAYGIALLVIVLRPSRARAFLIVTTLLALSLLITACVDVANGSTPLVGEIIHIPELLSLYLVWHLARAMPTADPAGSTPGPQAPAPRLLAIPSED